MGLFHRGQVDDQAFPCLPKPACDQADFLQPVPDGFGTVAQPFPARKRDPIDLICDFANEDLCLTCVRQVESCLQCHGFEAGRAVCLSLALNWPE